MSFKVFLLELETFADEARIELVCPIDDFVNLGITLSSTLHNLSVLLLPRRSSTPNAFDLSIITRLPNSLPDFGHAEFVTFLLSSDFRKTSRMIELVSVESLEKSDMKSSNSDGGAIREALLSEEGYLTKADE
jgi:hypothetical protein